MKWLMFKPARYMDAAGDGNGGGSGGAGAGDGGAGGSGDGKTAECGGQADGEGGEPKPFLGPTGGDGKNSDDGKTSGDGKDAEDGKPADDQPQTFEEKDYVEGIKKDEALLGNDANVKLDEGMIKAMAPTFKELGIKPEQASKLANALAKVQIDQGRQMLKSRNEFFQRMKDDAMRKYNDGDWSQINKGIDSCFKPDGVMNYMIRNSEIGADPEFLALMHKMGAAHVEDTGAGASAGAGANGGDGNTCAGISALWK